MFQIQFFEISAATDTSKRNKNVPSLVRKKTHQMHVCCIYMDILHLNILTTQRSDSHNNHTDNCIMLTIKMLLGNNSIF